MLKSAFFAAAAVAKALLRDFLPARPDDGARYGKDGNPETWRKYSARSRAEIGRRLRGPCPTSVGDQSSGEPVARSRPAAPDAIGRICKRASVDRKATASDALREAGSQAPKLGDPLVDPSGPVTR